MAGMTLIILTFPLLIFGNIFNMIFLGLPIWQARNIKDPQFVSSVRYAFSLILAILLLPLFLVLSLLLFPSWWIGLIIFLALPLSGLFAWNYYLLYKRIMGGFRIRKYISEKGKEFELLIVEYNELVSIVSGL
jgi:hypothetical protein